MIVLCLRECGAGAGAALRRWPIVVGLTVTASVAAVMMGLVLFTVLTEATIIGTRTQLGSHAVAFTPFYRTSSSAAPVLHTEALARLQRGVAGGDGYSTVIYNVKPNAVATAPSLLLVFGERASVALSDPVCAPTPSAQPGASLVLDPMDPLSVAGLSVPMGQGLRPGATLIDPAAGVISLDRRIVVHLPSQTLVHLDPLTQQEAAARLVLIDPTQPEVEDFVRACAADDLLLLPSPVGDISSFRSATVDALVTLAASVAFFLLALAAMLGLTDDAVRSEAVDLRVRTTYGATPVVVAWRWAGFVMALMALPTAALVVVSSLDDTPALRTALGWATAVVVLGGVGVWCRAQWQTARAVTGVGALV